MIYLACPFWHGDPVMRHRRVLKSAKAAAWIAAQNLFVFSPLLHSERIAAEGVTGEDYWREHGIAMVMRCESVAVLTIPGWQESMGVQAEIDAARESGLSVRYIEETRTSFVWEDKRGLSDVRGRKAGH